MEYFRLFELPFCLQVDKAKVQKKYYELTRIFHPDHAMMKGDEEQSEALEMSATINKAKRVLDNADLLLEYVLTELHMIGEDDKNSLSPDFLMEMMEYNEALMDLKVEGDEEGLNRMRDKIEELGKQLTESVTSITSRPIDSWSEEEKGVLKSYYYQRKYLRRLLDV